MLLQSQKKIAAANLCLVVFLLLMFSVAIFNVIPNTEEEMESREDEISLTDITDNNGEEEEEEEDSIQLEFQENGVNVTNLLFMAFFIPIKDYSFACQIGEDDPQPPPIDQEDSMTNDDEFRYITRTR